MKLSEADFRPKRRVGVVPSPPRRKIPVLRLLILVVAAFLVYRNFDAYWPKVRSMLRSSASNRVAKKGYPSSTEGLAWVFSQDSTGAFLKKGPAREEDFCKSLESLKAGLCDEVGAVMKKGRWLKALDSPVLTRVEMRLSKTESNPVNDAVVVALEGRDGGKRFRYQRFDEKSPWCDPVGECLSPRSPTLPLAEGKSSEPAAGEPISRWTSARSSVHPVLPGKVVSVDSSGPESHRVILYHGRELYSIYEGVRHLAPGLVAGTSINSSPPIGEAGIGDSLSASESRYALRFRVEQAGVSLDPREFFETRPGVKP